MKTTRQERDAVRAEIAESREAAGQRSEPARQPMTDEEAGRVRACLVCGAPGALLFETAKETNHGRFVRVCQSCLRAGWLASFGLVERAPRADCWELPDVL